MSFLSDSFHLFIRWMKKLVRNPILIFFSLFQPVIFLVLFTQLFNKFGALLGPGVSYTVFATAGIVLQNAFSSAFQSGTAVVDTSAMPDWMKSVSNYRPISVAVNAMRNMITGCPPGQLSSNCTTGFDWSTILQAYGVIALIGVLTLGATLYLFRKVVS